MLTKTLQLPINLFFIKQILLYQIKDYFFYYLIPHYFRGSIFLIKNALKRKKTKYILKRGG
jgi:hypothetical protein